MIDHHGYGHNLSSCEIKAWKKNDLVLKKIRTLDFCDTGVLLRREPSYQAIWEFIMINPYKMNNTSEYIKFHIFELRREIWRYDWSSQLSAVQIYEISYIDLYSSPSTSMLEAQKLPSTQMA